MMSRDKRMKLPGDSDIEDSISNFDGSRVFCGDNFRIS